MFVPTYKLLGRDLLATLGMQNNVVKSDTEANTITIWDGSPNDTLNYVSLEGL